MGIYSISFRSSSARKRVRKARNRCVRTPGHDKANKHSTSNCRWLCLNAKYKRHKNKKQYGNAIETPKAATGANAIAVEESLDTANKRNKVMNKMLRRTMSIGQEEIEKPEETMNQDKLINLAQSKLNEWCEWDEEKKKPSCNRPAYMYRSGSGLNEDWFTKVIRFVLCISKKKDNSPSNRPQKAPATSPKRLDLGDPGAKAYALRHHVEGSDDDYYKRYVCLSVATFCYPSRHVSQGVDARPGVPHCRGYAPAHPTTASVKSSGLQHRLSARSVRLSPSRICPGTQSTMS